MPTAGRPGAASRAGTWQIVECYLVGGAVRDQLLGRPVTERDWVVVGATPEQMTALGYRPVGRDFPVFLHPASGEEYALARTERKTGPGYRGFQVHAEPDVSLEADLRRRDLTINAMARAGDGTLIDPCGGHADLDARLLRHVSPAFREDPVRILRLARFAARYAPMGFTVAPETLALCRQMVADGEVDALVPERVWQELARALMEPAPEVFVETLRDCDALARLLPEVDRLFGVPQRRDYHPEVDTGIHVLMAMRQSARMGADLATRFAVLLHDLGKAETPHDALPGHPGHEERGIPLVDAVCDRLRVPNDCRELARLVTRHHLACHRLAGMRANRVVALLEALDGFRKPDRVERFALACEADARGRAGLQDQPYPQAERLRLAHEAAGAVTARPFVARGLRGPAIAAAMHEARVGAVREALRATDTD